MAESQHESDACTDSDCSVADSDDSTETVVVSRDLWIRWSAQSRLSVSASSTDSAMQNEANESPSGESTLDARLISDGTQHALKTEPGSQDFPLGVSGAHAGATASRGETLVPTGEQKESNRSNSQAWQTVNVGRSIKAEHPAVVVIAPFNVKVENAPSASIGAGDTRTTTNTTFAANIVNAEQQSHSAPSATRGQPASESNISGSDSDFDELLSDDGSELDGFDDFLEGITRELNEGKYSDLREENTSESQTLSHSTQGSGRKTIKPEPRSPTHLSSAAKPHRVDVFKEARLSEPRDDPEPSALSAGIAPNHIPESVQSSTSVSAVHISANSLLQKSVASCRSNNEPSHTDFTPRDSPHISCSEVAVEPNVISQTTQQEENSAPKTELVKSASAGPASEEYDEETSGKPFHFDTAQKTAPSCKHQGISASSERSGLSELESPPTVNQTVSDVCTDAPPPMAASTATALVCDEEILPSVAVTADDSESLQESPGAAATEMRTDDQEAEVELCHRDDCAAANLTEGQRPFQETCGHEAAPEKVEDPSENEGARTCTPEHDTIDQSIQVDGLGGPQEGAGEGQFRPSSACSTHETEQHKMVDTNTQTDPPSSFAAPSKAKESLTSLWIPKVASGATGQDSAKHVDDYCEKTFWLLENFSEGLSKESDSQKTRSILDSAKEVRNGLNKRHGLPLSQQLTLCTNAVRSMLNALRKVSKRSSEKAVRKVREEEKKQKPTEVVPPFTAVHDRLGLAPADSKRCSETHSSSAHDRHRYPRTESSRYTETHPSNRNNDPGASYSSNRDPPVASSSSRKDPPSRRTPDCPQNQDPVPKSRERRDNPAGRGVHRDESRCKNDSTWAARQLPKSRKRILEDGFGLSFLCALSDRRAVDAVFSTAIRRLGTNYHVVFENKERLPATVRKRIPGSTRWQDVPSKRLKNELFTGFGIYLADLAELQNEFLPLNPFQTNPLPQQDDRCAQSERDIRLTFASEAESQETRRVAMTVDVPDTARHRSDGATLARGNDAEPSERRSQGKGRIDGVRLENDVPHSSLTSRSVQHAPEGVRHASGGVRHVSGGVRHTSGGERRNSEVWEEQCQMFLEKILPGGTAAVAEVRQQSTSGQRAPSPAAFMDVCEEVVPPSVAQPSNVPPPTPDNPLPRDGSESDLLPATNNRCLISVTISNREATPVSPGIVARDQVGLERVSSCSDMSLSDGPDNISGWTDPPSGGSHLGKAATGEQGDASGLRRVSSRLPSGHASATPPRSADSGSRCASARSGASLGDQKDAQELAHKIIQEGFGLLQDAQSSARRRRRDSDDGSFEARKRSRRHADPATQITVRLDELLCEEHGVVHDEPWETFLHLSTRLDGAATVLCPLCETDYAKTAILAHAETAHGVKKPGADDFNSCRMLSSADEPSRQVIRSVAVARSHHRSSPDDDSRDRRKTQRLRHRSSSNERPLGRSGHRSTSRERSRRSPLRSDDRRHYRSGRRSSSRERERNNWTSTRFRHRSASVESTRCFPVTGRSRHRSASVESTRGYPRMVRRRDRSSSGERHRRHGRSSSAERRRRRDRSPSPGRRWHWRCPDRSVRPRRHSPPGRRPGRISDIERTEPRYQPGRDRSRRRPSEEASRCQQSPDGVSRSRALDERSRHRSGDRMDSRPQMTFDGAWLNPELGETSTDSDFNPHLSDTASRENNKCQQTEDLGKARHLSPHSAPRKKPRLSTLERLGDPQSFTKDNPVTWSERSADVSTRQLMFEKFFRPSAAQLRSQLVEADSGSETSGERSCQSTPQISLNCQPKDKLNQSVPTQKAAAGGTPRRVFSMPIGFSKEELRKILSAIGASADTANSKQPSGNQPTPKGSCDPSTVDEEEEDYISVLNEEPCIDSSEEDQSSCLPENSGDGEALDHNKEGSSTGLSKSKITILNTKQAGKENQSSAPCSTSIQPEASEPQQDKQMSRLEPTEKQRWLQNDGQVAHSKPAEKQRKPPGSEQNKQATHPEPIQSQPKPSESGQERQMTQSEPGEMLPNASEPEQDRRGDMLPKPSESEQDSQVTQSESGEMLPKALEPEQERRVTDAEHRETHLEPGESKQDGLLTDLRPVEKQPRAATLRQKEQNTETSASDSTGAPPEASETVTVKEGEQPSKFEYVERQLPEMEKDKPESGLDPTERQPKTRTQESNVDAKENGEPGSSGRLKTPEPELEKHHRQATDPDSSEMLPKTGPKTEKEGDETFGVSVDTQSDAQESAQAKESENSPSPEKGSDIKTEPGLEQQDREKNSAKATPVEKGKDVGSKPDGSATAPLKPGTIRHRCTRCRVELSSWLSLRNHVKVCLKGPPPCAQCNRKVIDANKHRLVCSGRPPWLCPSCHKWSVDSRPRHRELCSAQCARCGEIGVHTCAGTPPMRSPLLRLPMASSLAFRPRGASPCAQGPVGQPIRVVPTRRHVSPGPRALRPARPRSGDHHQRALPLDDWAEEGPELWCEPCGRWGHNCLMYNAEEHWGRPDGQCQDCGAWGPHECRSHWRAGYPDRWHGSGF